MKAFISYSSADREFVRRLARDLQTHGAVIWLDEWEINVGDEIRQKVEHGIAEYDYFAIVLSKHSVASTWVEKELNAAFMKEVNTKRIVILPVKLEDCVIPLLISGKKYADFTVSYESGLNELLKVLSPPNWSIPKKTSSNVIYVDDDLSFAQGVADSLKRIGLSTSITFSPKAALELARRYKPDAILVNAWFALRGELTPNLVDELRHICPGIKIVGLGTADIYLELQKEVLELFDTILEKPITLQDIASALGIDKQG